MKKVFSFVLVCLVVCLFAACGSEGKPKTLMWI